MGRGKVRTSPQGKTQLACPASSTGACMGCMQRAHKVMMLRVYGQAHPWHMPAPWCWGGPYLGRSCAKHSPFPTEQEALRRAGVSGKTTFGTSVGGVACCWGSHGQKGYPGPQLFIPNASAGLLWTQGSQQGIQCFTQ